MTYATASSTVVARKPHNCTWCGQGIAKGERHSMWKSVDSKWFTNRMHPECELACADECNDYGDWGYMPFSNERPLAATTGKANEPD